MALAVLPTTMVHTSLLLGLRGRLRSMPLHSHAYGHVAVYGGEHACCWHACATFEAESMHAAVMHVARSRRRA